MVAPLNDMAGLLHNSISFIYYHESNQNEHRQTITLLGFCT